MYKASFKYKILFKYFFALFFLVWGTTSIAVDDTDAASIITKPIAVPRGDTSSLIPVKIALEWFLNPHHAPFIVAHTNGYFAEEGLLVNLHPARGSQEGCVQAVQGVVDFATTHEPQILIMKEKGIDLQAVAILIPHTLEVVLSNTPLDQFETSSPHPLIGKIIAHDSSGSGSLTFAVMNQFLKNQQLNSNDVTVMMAKNSVVSGFIAGKIDVVFSIYKTYQLHDIKKHKKQPFFVYDLSVFGVPSFASMVLVCGKNTQPTVRDKMMRALQKAIDFIHEFPKEAYECVRSHRPELDTNENKEVWPIIHSVFAKDVQPRNIGRAELREFLKNSQ